MKVTSVEVLALNFPVEVVLVLAGGGAATPGTLSPRVLVKVTADDGASGWGEATPTTLNGSQFIETTFLRERLWKGGGRVTVLEGRGLGVEVDEAYVRKHAVTGRMP